MDAGTLDEAEYLDRPDADLGRTRFEANGGKDGLGIRWNVSVLCYDDLWVPWRCTDDCTVPTAETVGQLVDSSPHVGVWDGYGLADVADVVNFIYFVGPWEILETQTLVTVGFKGSPLEIMLCPTEPGC